MRLNELRVLAGLTQEQAATALGVARTTVTMWETHQSNPTAGMLPAIAKLYHCTISDLFDDDEGSGNE